MVETVRPPLPQAMAVSPGAPLFAVSGHEQVLLYSGANRESRQIQAPVDDSLERQWTFDGDDGNIAGQVGNALRLKSDPKPVPVEPIIDFSRLSELTLSVWIRPRAGEGTPSIFAQDHGFTLFLEPHKGGWRPRVFLRDQDNGISYFGRVGFLANDEWRHLAVVWNGRSWNWFVDGQHIAEQKSPDTLKSIQQRPDAAQSIGGFVGATDKKLSVLAGDIDELRFYRRALSRDEINGLMREAAQAKTYKMLGALPFPEGTIHDIKFSRNGSLVLAAGGRGAHSGRVVLFDVKSGRRVAEVGDEFDSVLAADISPDHKHIVLGGPSKMVKVFDTGSGELLHAIKKHTDWVTAVSFSPDGKMFATGDRSGGVHIWETEKGAIVFTLNEHKVRITDIRWRSDGAIVATAAEDGNLILWSMKDGFPLRNIVAHASRESPRYSRRTGVLSLDFAPAGRLMTSGRDGLMRIWSADGNQQLEFRIDSGLPLCASFLDGDSTAVVGAFDGSLHIFDLGAKTRTQLLSTGPKRKRD